MHIRARDCILAGPLFLAVVRDKRCVQPSQTCLNAHTRQRESVGLLGCHSRHHNAALSAQEQARTRHTPQRNGVDTTTSLHHRKPILQRQQHVRSVAVTAAAEARTHLAFGSFACSSTTACPALVAAPPPAAYRFLARWHSSSRMQPSNSFPPHHLSNWSTVNMIDVDVDVDVDVVPCSREGKGGRREAKATRGRGGGACCNARANKKL